MEPKLEARVDFLTWLEDICDFKQADWEKLPDIGLYMDQVQTYIDRQLSVYHKDQKGKLLTPAMINNYIKDGLLARAEAKKYTPSHVALLIMIAALKQVLSMQKLKNLLSDYRAEEQVEKIYTHYLAHVQKDLNELSAEVKARIDTSLELERDQESSEQEFLRLLALELSIEASNRVLLSEKILEYVTQEADVKNQQAEKK